MTDLQATDGAMGDAIDGPAGAADGGIEDGSSPDWRAGIGDRQLREFAGRFATPGDLARTALDLRQKLSQSVKVPGRNASEAEHRAFAKSLGVPDDPAGYSVALPEGLPEELQLDDVGRQQMDGFLARMHAAGATPAVVQAALDHYYGLALDAYDAAKAGGAQAIENGQAALRRDWGGDYDVNVRAAQTAAMQFGDERFVELLETAKVDGVPLGDHPAFIKAFAGIGRRMMEDGPHVADSGGGTSGAVRDRIDELMRLMTADPQRYRSRGVQDELQDLHRQLDGDGPIVGIGGRKA